MLSTTTQALDMSSMTTRQLVNVVLISHIKSPLLTRFTELKSVAFTINVVGDHHHQFLKPDKYSRKHSLVSVPKASSSSSADTLEDEEEGVSLGTMKLPLDTDVVRFETLLFQWGNSLCQGANLPLPLPLKVDKIPGGARLGFITIGSDGNTEVLVHIDCLVFPGTEGSAPMFRAVRNGLKKDEAPPGEPRIMRSLLDALKKCVEIARL